MNKTVVCIFGTRPEAIKLAPVISELLSSGYNVINISTGQHTDMFDQVCRFFDLKIHYRLNLPDGARSLAATTTKILDGLDKVFSKECPDLALVHGDTTSTFCGALISFYNKVPVAHIEAGLRSGDIYAPWPEEMNRVLVASLSAYHFAPTVIAKENLIKMGISAERIFLTGNTVVDALSLATSKLEQNIPLHEELTDFFNFEPDKKVIMITIHRRENHGKPLERICDAIKRLDQLHDLQFYIPVHPHPNVKNIITSKLKGIRSVKLMDPLDYLKAIYLMSNSFLILTDSGGIQEEAPSLKKYTMVLRETTERLEAINAGLSTLIGTDQENIVRSVSKFIDSPIVSSAFSKNPYGNGKAAKKISHYVTEIFKDK